MGTAKQGRGGGLGALRSELARRFLIRIKRATHRAPPRLVTPTAKRVLVIAPHMDDEVIPCGGTLMLLSDAGAEVRVIYATDSAGPDGNCGLTEIRRTEAAQVQKHMRLSSFIELGYRDSQLHRNETALTKDFARELSTLDPDVVFCPFPADAHSDHMSCAAAFARATKQSGWNGAVFAYEVWTPLWPNVAVDISGVADRKEAAIRLYGSQMADRDYAAAALGLNRFRGLVHSVEFAEAFFESSASEFRQLAQLLDAV